MLPAGHRSPKDASSSPSAEDSAELLRQQLSSLQTSIDVSDETIVDFRRQAEASLFNIGSRLSPFLRELPCLAYIKDADGRYLYVNRHWERVYGKSFRDWHTKTDHDFWPAEIADELRRNDMEVLERRIPLQSIEVTPNDLGMGMCLVTKFAIENETGACGLLGGIAVDITQHKRSEEERHESGELYREVFERVPAGIHRSTFDGQVVLANPALLKMLGYDSTDQLPRSISKLSLTPEPQGDVARIDDAAQSVRITDEIWRKRDGSELHVRQSARIVRDKMGSARFYDAVVEDITIPWHAALLEKDRNRLLEMVANNERLGTIFEQLTALVERQAPGCHCSIMVVRGDRLHSAARGGLPDAFHSALHDGIEIGPNVGSCGSAAFHGQPIVVSDIATDSRCTQFRDVALANGLRACCSVPIRSGDQKTLGTLAVYYNRECSPNPSEMTLFEMTSRLAAVAIEHRQLYDNLTYRALYDEITGLANLVLFQDRFEDVLAAARQNTTQVALLWIDLDRFKEVNDTLGHRVGDLQLAQVGSRFARAVSAAEMVARIGGDEFAVIIPVVSGRAEAVECATRLLQALSPPMAIEEYELSVTASVGISIFPEDGCDAETLRRNADSAMYKAKSLGRNRAQCYEPQGAVQELERWKLSQSLPGALKGGQFELLYQPQVDLHGKLHRFEALLRWNHPKYGLISPAQFIPLAEESGVIVPIGTWVVEQACRQCAKWHAEGYPDIQVAVNVSALQFYYSDFVDVVRAALAESGLPPEYLQVELTESVLMRSVGESARQLHRLRNAGISIAVDDFGTGYSSLSYLHKLPVDALKIDRSFLADEDQAHTGRMLKAITGLAHSLNLAVVAEGVEKCEQWQLLCDVGVDLVQGFLIARPAAAASMLFNSFICPPTSRQRPSRV